MSVTTIVESYFQIPQPGFETTLFTQESPSLLDHPGAVHFTSFQNSALWSAREAAAWILEAGQDPESTGTHGADHPSITRTVAVYFFTPDQTCYAAIDDHADPAKNLILSRSHTGHKLNRAEKAWTASKKNPIVRAHIERAYESGRVVEITASIRDLVMAPGSGLDHEESAFGSDELVHAALLDRTTPYTLYLSQSRHYPVGRTITLSPEMILGIGSHDRVEIRAVAIGAHIINAGYTMTEEGYARGTISRPNTLPK